VTYSSLFFSEELLDMFDLLDADAVKQCFVSALQENFPNRGNIGIAFDASYFTTWSDSYSLDYARKEMAYINAGMIKPDSWHQKLQRLYNDQTVYLGDGHHLEPDCTPKLKLDKVTNQGLEVIAPRIIGTSDNAGSFLYMACGTGTTTASASDLALATEIKRVNMRTEGGSAVANKATLYFNGFFPKATTTGEISEAGIFDSADTANDNILLRTVLPDDDKISHIQNQDAPNISIIVYLCAA